MVSEPNRFWTLDSNFWRKKKKSQKSPYSRASSFPIFLFFFSNIQKSSKQIQKFPNPNIQKTKLRNWQIMIQIQFSKLTQIKIKIYLPAQYHHRRCPPTAMTIHLQYLRSIIWDCHPPITFAAITHHLRWTHSVLSFAVSCPQSNHYPPVLTPLPLHRLVSVQPPMLTRSNCRTSGNLK